MRTARYLKIRVVVNTTGTTTTGCVIWISSKSGNYRIYTIKAWGKGSTSANRYNEDYKTFVIDMGVPTYDICGFYIHAKPNSEGSAYDMAKFRIVRVYESDYLESGEVVDDVAERG